MFNRTVEFKITKPNKSEQPALTEDEKVDRFNQYREMAEAVVGDVARLVAAYMILDTFRKAAIARAAAQTCCRCRHL